MKFSTPPDATLLDDLSGLKVPITTQSQLDAIEFDNIYRAKQTYFKSRKFKDASWCKDFFFKEIHFAMFGEVWEWAGKYRSTEVLPIGVIPHKIPILVKELTQDIEFWTLHINEMTFLEMAARIHHRLTWIHPFPNGNGRFSRFVSDLFLFSYRGSLPIWPQINKEGSYRSDYISVLREADQGDFHPLINYISHLGAKNPLLKTLTKTRNLK